ncbi:MAG: phytanoyl-CoA dioxygenase family protein [Bacteroidetes bacterium]|nr:phytanoyl-CoA dioxygenase family protein [Bacteroidota bacterium]
MLSLKQKYLQDALAINGFFTIPFLNNSQIEALRNIYSANFDDQSTTFYATSFHPDFELKKKVSDQIIELLHTKLEEHFYDYKILGSSFLKKKPNDQNPLPLHQDWTVTDEEKYGSFTIWIPLQDTFKENGAIRIIPGSHSVDDNFRAPSLPVAFEEERAKFESHLITLPLKAGEAFVFNQKLMHASWPNKSMENRLALTIGLVPKAADLFMLYFDKNKNALSKFEMPTQMFLHYPEIIDKPLIGQILETKPFKPKKLNYDTFKEKLYLNRIQSNTMQPLFKDENQQQFFEKNGFIKIPVLEEKEIEQLKNYLFDSGIKKENDYGFYVAMDHDNKELVAQMMEKICTVALPKLTPHLKDYQLITASYVIKDPNPKGVVPPHQDWTFVEDETKHCSVTCWIALVDTDMDNGCMGVIKGSHKFFNSVRPSPSPQVPSPLAKHMFSLFPYFELLPMKAGEALIFDNRTFHSSPPNITAAPRLAVGLSFTQKEAELRHYFLKPDTKDVLLKYKIDQQFFMKYDNGKLAKMYDAGQKIEDYELMEEVKFQWEDLSKEQMKTRVLAAGNEYNKVLTTHMMKLFGDQMKSGVKDKIFNVLNLTKKIINRILK